MWGFSGDSITAEDAKIAKLRSNILCVLCALCNVRDALRSAVSELPDAPCYIILSLDSDDMDKWYARLEAGFVAGNMLLQGSAIGVGCWFTTGLNDSEQVRMGKAIGLEKADVPIAIVSTGYDK